MMRRATISVIGSFKSCKPSLARAAENASPIVFRSSGPKARLSLMNSRIGITSPRQDPASAADHTANFKSGTGPYASVRTIDHGIAGFTLANLSFLRLVRAVADYRKYAEECVRLAQRVRAPHQRAILLEIAGKWAELARQVEKEQAILHSADSEDRRGAGGPPDQIQVSPSGDSAPPRRSRS
jgi:hypothetical protein